MNKGHRYRLLIYFAALVLCLSVCFAYAEQPASLSTISGSAPTAERIPTTTTALAPIHLLLYTAPGRSSFMPALAVTLTSQTEPVSQPVYADGALQSLTVRENRSHGLIHALFPAKHKLKLVTVHTPEPMSASNSAPNAPSVEGEE